MKKAKIDIVDQHFAKEDETMKPNQCFLPKENFKTLLRLNGS